MRRKFHFHIETKHLFLILGAVCILLIAATTYNSFVSNTVQGSFSTVLSPFQRGMNRLGSFVYGGIANIKELFRAQEVNEELREEIAELRAQNARYQLRLDELAHYQDLLDLGDEYPEYHTVGAHIISKNSGNWFSTFKIDKGSSDGLAVNMNILSDGGLVGIITDVQARTATVSSIIDDGRSVAAMAVGSEAPCMVTGNALLWQEGTLDVSHVNKDDDIDVTYKIVTSNTSSEYLPGLLIGYISEIAVDNNNLTKSGKLVPVADFTHLDTVLVITDLKDAEG